MNAEQAYAAEQRIRGAAHELLAACREARLALADFLFSPDQLPRSFCDTWIMTRDLGGYGARPPGEGVF